MHVSDRDHSGNKDPTYDERLTPEGDVQHLGGLLLLSISPTVVVVGRGDRASVAGDLGDGGQVDPCIEKISNGGLPKFMW